MKRAALVGVLALVGPLLFAPASGATIPTCFGQPAAIVGTSGNDNLQGTPGNDVIDQDFPVPADYDGDGRLDPAVVQGGLEAAGVAVREGVVEALIDEAREHAVRVALEKAGRRTVKGLDRPTYELPLLAEGVDLGGLYALAERLCQQGAA